METLDPSSLREAYHHNSRSEYETLLLLVVAEIREVLETTDIRFQIKHRVKDFEEYMNKLCLGADGKPATTRIDDILGIRIVCPFLEDLDEVERILSSRFDLSEVDKKQHGQSFQEFGYDATHLLLDLHGRTVAHPLPLASAVCEIQLRTILQDAWAEVEHELIYKSDWPIPTYQIRRKLAALNANLTLSDIIFQELREFQREIFRKQNKRRSLADDAFELHSKKELHSVLFGDNAGTGATVNLEKTIIEALTAHAEESFDIAISLYTRALDMQGGESVHSILCNHRGMAYLALGNFDLSLIDFSAATASDPANYRAWYNLGIALKSHRDLSGARNAFEMCLKICPSFSSAGVKLIYLLLEMGEHLAAAEALLELKRHTPDLPELPALKKLLEGAGDPME